MIFFTILIYIYNIFVVCIEKLDYENVICTVIAKRTAATKLCRDMGEKNLAIGKKIMVKILITDLMCSNCQYMFTYPLRKLLKLLVML
jgi:hypothetical protein